MAWYNASWTYRKSFTVDKTKLTADVSDFPVFLKLDDLGSDFWSAVKNGGGDIRITKSDGTTELAREIVICNTSTSKGELHFKADSVSSSTNTVFYIYYGNAGASDYAATDTYGRNNVWDSNYVGVWHMSEANVVDSTGNGLTGTNTNSTDSASPKVGSARTFSGSDQYIEIPAMNLSTPPISISTWLKRNGTQGDYDGIIFSRASGTVAGIHTMADHRLGYHWSNLFANFNTGHTLTDNTWEYATLAISGTNSGIMYKNGIAGTTNTDHHWPQTFAGVTYFGQDSEGGRFFAGDIDEVRISNIARSSDWITAEYNNQNSPSTFYALGSQESGGAAPTPIVYIIIL